MLPVLTRSDVLAAERELCQRSLVDFIRRAWKVVEPGTEYIHGWHMDALCQHLEAVSAGQINRLLINIPPGTMKSLATNVFWPAWEWTRAPHLRVIGASHEEGLATRDCMKMRRLVASPWYQSLWPIKMVGDNNAKTQFENARSGWRQSSPVRSMTGRRGDRVIWDDPHSVEDAHSAAQLETAIRVFRETLPTRINNPEKSAIVIIMQRLSERDVSGEIISRDLGYEKLILPMEFEPSRRCVTSIGFSDPRTEPGELLFPQRFPRHVVERDKAIMGSYAVAGQFQQRPAPVGGLVFKPENISIIDAVPAGTQFVRAWDFAGTAGGGDWTVGAKIGKMPDGRIVVADVLRFQKDPSGVRMALRGTAEQDGVNVRQRLPQDPGQAGKDQAQSMTRELAGFTVTTKLVSGDKVTRAEPFASQVNVGNVCLVRAPWNVLYLDELRTFPKGMNDDQVDASSDAFNELVGGGGGAEALFAHLQRMYEAKQKEPA